MKESCLKQQAWSLKKVWMAGWPSQDFIDTFEWMYPFKRWYVQVFGGFHPVLQVYQTIKGRRLDLSDLSDLAQRWGPKIGPPVLNQAKGLPQLILLLAWTLSMQLLPIEVLGFSPNAESSLAYKQISLSHSSHTSNIRKRRRSTKGLVLPFPDLASTCKSNEKHLFRWVLPLQGSCVRMRTATWRMSSSKNLLMGSGSWQGSGSSNATAKGHAPSERLRLVSSFHIWKRCNHVLYDVQHSVKRYL